MSIRPVEVYSRRVRGQFTLLELLVLLSVMVILAALLLPFLLRCVEQGRRVACANNMGQYFTATAKYAVEWNNMVPVMTGYPWAPGGVTHDGMYFSRDYLGQVHVAPCSAAGTYWTYGYPANYNNLLRCPSRWNRLDWTPEPWAYQYRFCGFSPADARGGTGFVRTPLYLRFNKIGRRGPKGPLVMMDDATSGPTTGASYSYWNNHSREWPTYRGGDGGNSLFGDGSAKWIEMRDRGGDWSFPKNTYYFPYYYIPGNPAYEYPEMKRLFGAGG